MPLFDNPAINYQIIGPICDALSQHDLYNLLFMNHQFYQLVLPKLYNSITISESHSSDSAATTYIRTTDSRSSLHNSKKILESLIQNPGKLVQLIHKIQIRQDVWFKDVICDIVNLISHHDTNSIQYFKCDHKYSIWNSNRDKFCYRCCDINRTKLMCKGKLEILQCNGDQDFCQLVQNSESKKIWSNLKQLEIYESSRGVPSILQQQSMVVRPTLRRTITGTSNLNTILKNLQSISIFYDSYWFIMNNDLGMNDDMYPNLQNLSIDLILRRDSPILTNNFHDFYNKLSQFISSCPNLTTLRFRFNFENLSYLENYLYKFLSLIKQRRVSNNNKNKPCFVDLVISIKNLTCSDQESIIVTHVNDLIHDDEYELSDYKITIFNNCNEYYIDHK